jgi:addiction module HigA family antidote
MSKMHNPPHPGEIVRDILIEATGLTVTAASTKLGITRVSLSKLINCRCNISPEMALRLSIALNTSPEMWLNMQQTYDLWVMEKNRNKLKREVSRISRTIRAKAKHGAKNKVIKI